MDRSEIDPRDAHHEEEMKGRDPIFRYHNCYRCKDGLFSCVKADPRECKYLLARND